YQSFQIEADKKLNELTSNEEVRISQENNRIENENFRLQQEDIRQLNEIKRIENENLRKSTVEDIEVYYAPRLTTVENTLGEITPKVDLATIDVQTGLSVQSQKSDDCIAELKIEGATTIIPADPELEISPNNVATIANAKEFNIVACGKNLLPNNGKITSEAAGVTYIKNPDNSITANGISTGVSTYVINDLFALKKGNYVMHRIENAPSDVTIEFIKGSSSGEVIGRV